MTGWPRPALGLVLLVFGLSAPYTAYASQLSLDMRLTPPLERPSDKGSLGLLLAFAPGKHWWTGVGFESVQDYDAIVWTSENEGHKPVVMSGLRAGSWYRGGVVRNGFTCSVGGLLTVANRAFSIDRSPGQLDNGTYVVDFGADLTLGHVWEVVRLELFATPAWSYGRIHSPAVHTNERFNALTYRIGLALGVQFDLSAPRDAPAGE